MMIASTSLRWRARLQKEAINNSDAYTTANADDSNASTLLPSPSKFNVNNNNNNNLLYSPSKPLMTTTTTTTTSVQLLPMKLDTIMLPFISMVACCTSLYSLTSILLTSSTTATAQHILLTSISLIFIIITSLITLHQQYKLEQKGARSLPRRVQQVQHRRLQLQQQQERFYRNLKRLDPQVDVMYQTQTKIQRHLSLCTSSNNNNNNSNNRINGSKRAQQHERLCQTAQQWRLACHKLQQALLQQVQMIIIQTALEINQHLYHHHTTSTSNNNNKNVPTSSISSSNAESSISCSRRLLERILLRLGHVPGIDLDKVALRQYWEEQQQQPRQEVRHKDKKDDDDETILAWRLVLCLLRRVVLEGQSQQQQHGTAAAARISNHDSDDDDDYTIESCMFRFQPSKLLLQTTETVEASRASTTTRPSSQSSDHLHEC